MKPDFDSPEVDIDPFSPCPGCGAIGHTVQAWSHTGGSDERPIQMMNCPNEQSECRVDNYYPREA